MFKGILPKGHANCDDLIARGTPLPKSHPLIQPYLCEASVYSSGVLMAILVGCVFSGTVFVKVLYLLSKSFDSSPKAVVLHESSKLASEVEMGQRRVVPIAVAITGDCPELVADDRDAARFGVVCVQDVERCRLEEDSPSEVLQIIGQSTPRRQGSDLDLNVEGLPRRDRQLRDMERRNSLHRRTVHVSDQYADMPLPTSSGTVRVPPEALQQLSPESRVRLSQRLGVSESALDAVPEWSGVNTKSNSLFSRVKAVVTHYRLSYVDWSLGNVQGFVLYLSLNVLCLVLAPSQDYG